MCGSGQRGGVEQPVAALCGGVHQGAVLRLELRLEGVNTVQRLAALASLYREQGRVLMAAVGAAERGDPKFADGERMGTGK